MAAPAPAAAAEQEPLLVVLQRAVDKAVRHQVGLEPSASDDEKKTAELAVAEAKLAVAKEELAIAKAKFAAAEAAGADTATRDPLEVAVAKAKAGVAETKLTEARQRGATQAELTRLETAATTLTQAFTDGASLLLLTSDAFD